MNDIVNIIIPSISIDNRLIRCLKGISDLNCKNFFVTLILDEEKNLENLDKFNYKINKIIQTKKLNMSKKRNLGAKSFTSDYLAFIDSDACPDKNWLNNAMRIIKEKKYKIVGGPNVFFEDQNYWQKISYFCKRSFFVTGNYNFIKYRTDDRECEWLDSSNFLIEKKIYESINGMNEELYIGEDHDFFYRVKEKNQNLKIFYSKDVFVFHEDRELFYYFFQRFVYGLNVFAAKNTFQKRLFALSPFIILFIFILLLFFLDKNMITMIILTTLTIIVPLIYIELTSYVKNIKDKFLTILGVVISNIFYALGTFFALIGFRKILEKKIYRNIRN